MDLAKSSPAARPVTDGVLPVMRKLIPDPCEEWIETESHGRWGMNELVYHCRRNDGLEFCLRIEEPKAPAIFLGNKADRMPWKPSHDIAHRLPTLVEECYLWAKKEDRDHLLVGHLPLRSKHFWEICSGGGGCEATYELIERNRFFAQLKALDRQFPHKEVTYVLKMNGAGLAFPIFPRGPRFEGRYTAAVEMADPPTYLYTTRDQCGWYLQEALELHKGLAEILRIAALPEMRLFLGDQRS